MRFRIVIYLCALVLMIGGSDLYAASNAQKRAKQRAKTEQKRAAAKRKAEKKRAAKLKADKKKRIKEGKPLLYVYSYNLKTGEPLPATHITVQEQNARPNKKPKVSKPTDNKRARVSRGLPNGQYWAAAAKTGFFSSDTIRFTHREDEDTVKVYLYPETRLTFTVTDSLTSRPVAANIIVRNHERKRIMQTTSDTLHSVLAVLLDDRVPFYTIDATAVDYFPFRDTITDPKLFGGVVMSPKEVKSFVLHNIYFANGKISAADAADFDFKATLSSDGDVSISQDNVHYLYSGFTSKWKPYSSTTTPPTEPGRYVVTVVTLGGNYQAAPITRSFQITK